MVLFHARNFGALHGSSLARDNLLASVVFDWGRGGVAIFFVLSGFVIAHSLSRAEVSGDFVWRFMVKRSVRLDPPYWASIALAVSIAAVRSTSHADAALNVTPGLLLAHILYLQELLRLPEIQVIYWTLTYEIQFYFVYALLLWWNRATAMKLPKWAAIVPTLLLLAAALFAAAQPHEWVLHGLFLNYWHAFAAGVLAYLGGHRKRMSAFVLCILCACIMLASAPYTAEVFNTPAALTAIGLAILGRFDRLSGLTARPLKGLGTISYSLYLTHVPAILLGISIGSRLLGVGAAAGFATLIFSIALAVGFASLFWWVIERPSHAVARRLATTSRPKDAPAAIGATP